MILSFSRTKYIKKVKNKIGIRGTRTRSTCLINWFLENMVNHGLTINHGFWMVFGGTMVFPTIAALWLGVAGGKNWGLQKVKKAQIFRINGT
jgi:hypothetical protein